MDVQAEEWPLAKPFVIARGSKTHAHVVTVKLSASGALGRGECVPYARYGESVEGVIKAIEAMRPDIEAGLDRISLRSAMPAGAARNALDCALWDLEAKRTGQSVYQMQGMKMPIWVPSVQTVSIAEPAMMEKEARALASFPIIKVKLDADEIVGRIKAIRRGTPEAKLIVDANESWSLGVLNEVAPYLKLLGVTVIEQPLKAGDDTALRDYTGTVPLGADESCHTSGDLAALRPYYDVANIKLDKAGGLTEALQMQETARELGMGVMIGSMVSTSLALAPAVLLAARADYVDLDSVNLLATDRPDAMALAEGRLTNINGRLWGGG